MEIHSIAMETALKWSIMNCTTSFILYALFLAESLASHFKLYAKFKNSNIFWNLLTDMTRLETGLKQIISASILTNVRLSSKFEQVYQQVQD